VIENNSAVASAMTDLSSDQHRLWFLSKLHPQSVEYNVDAAYRLRGPVHVDALGRAVDLVVARHDVLRAHVAEVHGEPRLAVTDPSPGLMGVHDLSAEPDPEAAVVALARSMTGKPFDLAQGPLLRCWLARINRNEAAHVWGIVAHHLVLDRDSVDIVLREIGTAYAAFTAGTVPDLPALPVQYGDYAAWQRRRAVAPGREQDRAYWREQLRYVPVMVELPTDRPRPARPSYRAGEVPVRVDPQTVAALRSLAGAHRTTLFVPALAALQALLLRCSPGATAVTVGCPFNARTRVEYEPLVGFFARSLPIVAALRGEPDPAFANLVARCREVMLAAHEHQELPLDEIVQIVGPPRDLGHNPLFQVWFDLTERPADEPGSTASWLPGVQVSGAATGDERIRLDLELHLTGAADGGLGGRLLYATDLFEHDTAGEFVGHYVQLLANAVTNPGTRLSRIPMLTDGERALILEGWGVGAGRAA
jgi:hypothetical protein